MQIKFIGSFLKIAIVYGLFILSISCAGIDFTTWRFPYSMPINQGVVINKIQLQQLHINMTKEDIMILIGTPLSQYLFDKNRWDFAYQEYQDGKLYKQNTLSLFFDKSDHLIKIIH